MYPPRPKSSDCPKIRRISAIIIRTISIIISTSSRPLILVLVYHEAGYTLYYRHTDLFIILGELWIFENYAKPFCRLGRGR